MNLNYETTKIIILFFSLPIFLIALGFVEGDMNVNAQIDCSRYDGVDDYISINGGDVTDPNDRYREEFAESCIVDCGREVENPAGDVIKVNRNLEQCESPRLRELQDLVVRGIYLVWIGGLSVFSFAFVYIGYMYMTSGDDAQKKAQLRKYATYVIVAIIAFAASQPIAAAGMRLAVTSESECFADVRGIPAFRFFFADVCVGSQAGRACTNQDDTFCENQCNANNIDPGQEFSFSNSNNESVVCICGNNTDLDSYCSVVNPAGTPTPTRDPADPRI
jgi:hypothetical protein